MPPISVTLLMTVVPMVAKTTVAVMTMTMMMMPMAMVRMLLLSELVPNSPPTPRWLATPPKTSVHPTLPVPRARIMLGEKTLRSRIQ